MNDNLQNEVLNHAQAMNESAGAEVALRKEKPNDNKKLPFLHSQAKRQASEAGCIIANDGFTGTDQQIEAFMMVQNPMFQTQYNQRRFLDGRWSMTARVLNKPLPVVPVVPNKILMSVSAVQSDKTVSTGFHPVAYDTLEELAEQMHLFAHSPSIYSPTYRHDKYSKQMIWDYRRRILPVSFTGNMLVYDFDDGSLSFGDAVNIAHRMLQQDGMPSLIIRSKSDPKYQYDRFKMAVQTNILYPRYPKDEVPDGFERGDNYKAVYEHVADKYGLTPHMDESTKDISRLIARVTNADAERREYVVVR